MKKSLILLLACLCSGLNAQVVRVRDHLLEKIAIQTLASHAPALKSAGVCLRDSSISGYWFQNQWGNQLKSVYNYDSRYNVILQKDYNISNGFNSENGRIFSEYDKNNNQVKQLRQSVFGSQVTNSYQYLRSFDILGNQLTEVFQNWDFVNTAWMDTWRSTCTYTNSSSMLSEVFERWNPAKAIWVGDWRYATIYNGSKLLEERYEYWDTLSKKYVAEEKYIYSYNSAGKITQGFAYQWSYTLNAWENALQVTVTYNSNGLMNQAVLKSWNATQSQWVSDERYTYTYNSAGLITYLLEEFYDPSSSLWLKGATNSFQYNPGGQTTEMVVEEYDQTGSSITHRYRETNTYDSKGNHTGVLYENGTATTWENSSRELHYYNCTTVGVQGLNANALSIWPNPATDQITVSGISSFSYQVLDLQGRLLAKGNSTGAIPLRDLSAGVYFLVVSQQGAQDQVTKFIKE